MNLLIKIIGSIAITTALFGAVDDTRVSMLINDYDGLPLTKTALLVPFIVEVVVNNQQQGSVDIEHDDSISLESIGVMHSTHSINGVSLRKTHYRYKATANKQGSFFVGPAFFNNGQQDYQSERIKIDVVQELNTQKKGIFLAYEKPEKPFVVGQKITIPLRLYIPQSIRISLENIELPTIAHAHNSLSKPVQTIQTVDDTEYDCVEWVLTVYPEKAGTLIIPPATIIYNQENKRNGHDQIARFFSMFASSERKRMYSNTVQLAIDPLPATTKNVQAIGTFNSFNATLEPVNKTASYTMGQAITLVVTLEGDGNFVDIKSIPIQVPDSLQLYESKTVYNDNASVKTFEYIIQPLQTGLLEIPEQYFHYFDTDLHTYKTLQTQPISLSIEPSAVVLAQQGVQQEENNTITQETSPEELLPLPLDKRGNWRPASDTTLSTKMVYVFYSLYTLALLIMLVRLLGFLLNDFLCRCFLLLRKKYAWARAKKQLAHVFQTRQATMLQHIIVQAVADRTGMNKVMIHQSSIRIVLEKSGLPLTQLQQWDDWYQKVQSHVFGVDKLVPLSLLQEAPYWIKLLCTRL